MKTTLNALHHQAADWTRELDFYKEELAILTRRLEEVAKANTKQEVMKQVEHYQNVFIILRERLDILRHEVGIAAHQVTEAAKERPEHIDEKFSTANTKLQNRMNSYAWDLAETRFDFNNFLTRTM